VLAAQEVVLARLKAGVQWEDMHRLARDIILDGLINADLVRGSTEELKSNYIAELFFPHGLGHLIGLDVHDCAGYPAGVERINEPGIKYLRMRRTLQPSMVVTVEPGLYFVDAILDPAIADPKISKYLNIPLIQQYRSKVGGVRIEDDVLILKDGIENLTGWIPKTIRDIEAVMNGQV
jgi:Xaa-Pro dipeptidase